MMVDKQDKWREQDSIFIHNLGSSCGSSSSSSSSSSGSITVLSDDNEGRL